MTTWLTDRYSEWDKGLCVNFFHNVNGFQKVSLSFRFPFAFPALYSSTCLPPSHFSRSPSVPTRFLSSSLSCSFSSSLSIHTFSFYPPSSSLSFLPFPSQAWADAFRNSPSLAGVVGVYEDLRRRGLEFPMTDLDALSPIHTPNRVSRRRIRAHRVDRTRSISALPPSTYSIEMTVVSCLSRVFQRTART